MLVYLASYMGRKAYDSNINNVMEFYGVDKGTAGLVGTFFFFAYAVGQVIHGLFCRYYPKRWSIAIASVVSATMTLLMGLMPREGFRFLKYFWLVNGLALSSLWSSFVLIFVTSMAKVHRKKALFLMAFPTSIGTFISYGLSSLFTVLNNYKCMFYIGAGLLYLFGTVWFIISDKLIKSCIAEKRELDGLGAPTTRVKAESVKSKTSDKVAFFSVIMIIVFLLAIIDNFVKDGITTWAPTIFKEKYGLENWLSILISLGIPLCAIIGSITVLSMSKKIKSPILINCIMFCAGTLVLGLLILLFSSDVWIVALICFMIMSAIMSGINNDITNIFPMTYVHSKHAGIAAGLIDGFCYVGSALSSFGLGAVATDLGWNGVLWILFGACAFGFIVCSIYSCFEAAKKRKTAKMI